MIIAINDKLDPCRNENLPTRVSNSGTLEYYFGKNKIHLLSRSEIVLEKWCSGRANKLPFQCMSNLFVDSAHQAFSNHLGMTVSPEVVWHIITNEVAKFVNKNHEKYEFLFTKTPGAKKILQVEDDHLIYGAQNNDWVSTVAGFIPLLKENIPSDMLDVCLQTFTTSTPESTTASVITFMDTCSKFYDYRVMTLCGIPKFNILGSKEDWEKIALNCIVLAMSLPELKEYFERLVTVVLEIAKAFDGEVNKEFWNSFYKYSSGSGSAQISGWINLLFAHQSTSAGPRIKERFDGKKSTRKDFEGCDFCESNSLVPVVWDYLGEIHNLKFVSGIFGVEVLENCLAPKLGYAILEST